MVEETFIWTEIWKTQEALIPFPKGQDARYGSSECPPALNYFAPLIIAPLNNNNKKNKEGKKQNFVFFKGYIYTKQISKISTKNAPKWLQSAETWKFSRNAMFLSKGVSLD